jgi:NAD(P)-dependent dehydrogenase (short-subunit alcohol dehydrogenase family)
MNNVAFVTGADRGLGLALTAGLLDKGWRVFAGQYLPDWPELNRLAGQAAGRLTSIPLDVTARPSAQAAAQAVAASVSHVDLLINNAGVISPASQRSIREPQDDDELHRLMDVNAYGPLRVVEAFLPLLDRGKLKRLCFISSEAGSIGRARRTSWYGYCMSKAALNMGVKIMFNHLRPEGYTFRLYHPGWMRTYMSGTKNPAADLEPEEAAIPALAYFLQELTPDARLPEPSGEDRLVMRDWQGKEWDW